MCRIAGFWDRSDRSDYDYRSTLEGMRDALSYGGPDASGVYVQEDPGIAFGHRRLSIIDLSELGNQPMEFEHLVITYNGEVYNYEEVRKALVDIGYDFRSHSDTEIILKAFHAWGKDCVKRFHGMWAFAIFDRQANELHLCRDRIGVKPLYYHHENGLFAFASELKAFLKHPSFVPKLNVRAIKHFVKYGYISAPETPYRSVKKLMPGQWLTVGKDGRTTAAVYWQLENKPTTAMGEDEWVRHTKDVLQKSVDFRMVADVPVGVFLSGGIDSSLVTALLQGNRSQSISTFTIGFDDPRFDESDVARRIAKHLGTNHNEWICTEQEALDLVSKLPKVYDEPLGDASAIPTMLVAQKTREHVKVALSADGGDEMFAGYNAFYEVLKLVQGQRPPARSSLKYSVASAFGKKRAFLTDPALYREEMIRRSLRNKACHIDLLEIQMSFGDSAMVDWLFIDKSPAQLPRHDMAVHSHVIDEMANWDILNYLPDDIMHKVDRATMHVALEAREPLLDQDVLDLAFQLPLDMKYRDGQRKYILKKILADYLPPDILNLPKRGFSPPVHQWLGMALRGLVEYHFDEKRIRRQGIFDAHVMRSIKKHALETQLIHAKFLWNLLVFQMWYEEYFGD